MARILPDLRADVHRAIVLALEPDRGLGESGQLVPAGLYCARPAHSVALARSIDQLLYYLISP